MDFNQIIIPEVAVNPAAVDSTLQVNNNNNTQNSSFLQANDFSTLNQLTVTKPHKNPLFNLFHHHHKEEFQLVRFNNSANNLIDYSSDALLQYCRDNNFNAVKEIISFDSCNYRTDGSELSPADAANNMQAIKNIKIDLEYLDEVF